MSRHQRIAHWTGLALTAPILFIAGRALVRWLNGEYPPSVTIDDVSYVLGLSAVGMVLMYLMCRAIAWVMEKWA